MATPADVLQLGEEPLDQVAHAAAESEYETLRKQSFWLSDTFDRIINDSGKKTDVLVVWVESDHA